MENEFSGTIVGSVDVTINMASRVKSSLSIAHFEAAKLFSDMATQIETAESSLPYPQPGLSKLRSFSIASVIHSVAAAEAKINEMYLHVVDGTLPPMKELSIKKLEILKEVWADIEKLQMLRKYQIFLSACESASFDVGAEPYQSMALLVSLRNSLVHYKSQWDDENAEHAKLQQKLSNKFSANTLFNSALGSKAWFPHLCLGQGCANWAVVSAKAFLGEFYTSLSLSDNPFV